MERRIYEAEKKLARAEARLYRQCVELAKTFSTKDRNNIIKTTIEIKTLKDILNE